MTLIFFVYTERATSETRATNISWWRWNALHSMLLTYRGMGRLHGNIMQNTEKVIHNFERDSIGHNFDCDAKRHQPSQWSRFLCSLGDLEIWMLGRVYIYIYICMWCKLTCEHLRCGIYDVVNRAMNDDFMIMGMTTTTMDKWREEICIVYSRRATFSENNLRCFA